jgi:WD40 repeat protein
MRKQELLRTDVKERTVNLEYFKRIYKILPLNTNKHFNTLLELQNFQADSDHIWVAKFSNDHRYLATGGTSRVLKIWEIYTYEQSFENYEGDFKEFLPFLNETAFRIYSEHSDSIIDIAWSYNDNNVLYTASLDHYIIMWDLNELSCVKKFEHISMLISISLDPSVSANV